jgi:hypothetical protein
MQLILIHSFRGLGAGELVLSFVIFERRVGYTS